jgi:hypothetical protein
MKIRILALALALGCGMAGTANASKAPKQPKTKVYKTVGKAPKNRIVRPKSRAKSVKPRKAKKARAHHNG